MVVPRKRRNLEKLKCLVDVTAKPLRDGHRRRTRSPAAGSDIDLEGGPGDIVAESSSAVRVQCRRQFQGDVVFVDLSFLRAYQVRISP